MSKWWNLKLLNLMRPKLTKGSHVQTKFILDKEKLRIASGDR